MGLFQQVFDDSLKRLRMVAYPGFVDIVSTNGSQGAVNFTLTGQTLTTLNWLDVFIDGRMQTENTHYTRDVTNNRIVVSSPGVDLGSEVRIRLFLR